RSDVHRNEYGAHTVRDHRFPGRPSGDDAGAARQVGPGPYAPRGAGPCLTELFWRIAMRKVDPKVEEAVETLNMKDGPTRRTLLSGTGLISATAAASALLAACSSSSSTSEAAKAGAGNFPSTPKWQFWFVNHVYANPFFVPTQYGFQDAAALLSLPVPKWGGSASASSVSEMVSFFNSAVAAKAHASRSATMLISRLGSPAPETTAMNAGIPVISYNADGTVSNGVANIGTNRLCYVGQALYNSGVAMGNRIKSLISTPGDVVIFI